MNVVVTHSGFITTVQDPGRTGYRQTGVSRSGALDAHALRVANALVGNDDSAAGLEVTMGNLRLRFEDERMVAWCGGAFVVRIGDVVLPPGHAGLVSAEEELVVTAPNEGSRGWLAISGGIEVPPILGSRSTDLRGNFGGHHGRVLRDGDVLVLGKERRFETAAPWISEWSAPAPWASFPSRDRFLRIVRGPDWERFTSDAQTALVAQQFTVTPDSDRMGARLDGPELTRVNSDDLLSEAVAPGTLQVPPNGKPILLLGDCQTIGGYPKIAHVITVDLPAAEQLLLEREDDFARFRLGLELRGS